MSADNVITILSTPRPNGGRIYRVKEHSDGSSPIGYRRHADGQFKAYCRDVVCLVSIFKDVKRYDSEHEADLDAYHWNEDICSRYGVEYAELDQTWEELVAMAKMIEARRSYCQPNGLVPTENLGDSEEDVHGFNACSSPNFIADHLRYKGWRPEEIDAVCNLLAEIRTQAQHGWFDCLRLARAANPDEMEVFAAVKDSAMARASGCGSSYERIVPVTVADSAPSTVLIGFNFDH